jgi:hypothetical protein
VTTVAVVGAASGCPLVTMRSCAPETVSTVDVVRQVSARCLVAAEGSPYSPQTSCG